uniref:Putative WRKY transcription factor 4 n=1 Tax=Anthurium amnicola TaxID=1678845 RepID=A0A1D1XTV7_9ARAE
MAEEPSSGAPEQHEKPDEVVGEKPPKPPPPPLSSSPSPRPESSPSPPAPATAAAVPAPAPDPAVSSSSVPAVRPAVKSAKTSAKKTLAITVPVTPNSGASDGSQQGGGCRSFSQLLAGAMASPLGNSLAMPVVAVPVDTVRLPVVAVPCFIAPAALLESPGLAGQFAMTHQAVLATVTAQAQIQLQSGYAPSSMMPTMTAVPIRQRPPSASEDNVLSSEAEKQPSSDEKLQSAQIVLKTTSGDKFNWRKYGQKQVKSSESSRSYYRCTQVNCSAKKKVEHCQDGRVIEVIYKGGHNHDPPQKIKSPRERRRHSITPGENGTLTFGIEASGTLSSPSKMEQDSGSDTPEQQLHCSSDCEADVGLKVEEDLDEEPDLKRRLTERQVAVPSPLFKAVKEPKVVVQKASDAGLSSDAYKWRKYGQKIVKGNPNPRSYYKCTQMGCPARKHVEKDSTDAKTIIMHYEGKHNHDLPPTKNGSDPPATALLMAAAAALDADGCVQSPCSSVEKSPRLEQQPDADSKIIGEKASEVGGANALESAQTLLSIGFKSTSEENVRRDGSDISPRPLFDENHAVPVPNS